jgi:gliding motility-associated-like protein
MINPDSVFWDFGDSTTSSLFNPSHSFTTNGTKTIKLKLINKNGCIDSITKTIQISQAPIADFTSSSLCEGDTINFLDSSNTNSISWSWDFDNGSTSQGINNPYSIFKSPGTYDITMAILDSNMCADTIIKSIIIKEKISANLGSQINYCDSSYTINLNLPTGSSVLWSNGSISPNITFSQSGVYNVSINSNGCKNTDTFNLNLKTKPLAQFSAYDLCVDETLNLSNSSIGSIFLYSWDFGNGSASTIMNPTTSYSDPGSYNIELVVSSINNCKDTFINSINVTKAPNLKLGPDIKTCDNIINLSAGINNSTYLWSNGSTSSTSTFNQSGLIWLNVDSGNCSVSDSINFIIHEKPNADFSVEGACTNDTLRLKDISTFNQSQIKQWSWNLNNDIFNTNEVHKSFNNMGNISVKLVVSNDVGCRDSIQKNITINEPGQSQISTSTDLNILKGEEALLEAYGNGQSYLWSPEELTYDPYNSSTLSFPEESTTFFVYSYDNQGCLIQDSIRVEVYNDTKVFIPTAFTPNNDGKNDLFYISGDFICDIEYMIFNRWGQIVFEANDINKRWDGSYKGIKQNNEAYTVIGKAILCDNTNKNFKQKLHLIR